MKQDNKKPHFLLGQLYVSDLETELGSGIVIGVEFKTVKVFFPGSEGLRNYNQQNAPLRRVVFDIGDEVLGPKGEKFFIESVQERAGLYFYHGNVGEFPESVLTKITGHHHPLEKLLHAQVDSLELFQLRYETLQKRRDLLLSSVRGLMGGRMALLPHQLYIASEVIQRAAPRILLADEVGLGKTIEAGLILHNLMITSRVARVLIITPSTLVHQWFVEMLRRFHLGLKVLADQDELEDEGSEENPFDQDQLIITSLELLESRPSLYQQISMVKWDLLIVDEAHRLEWSPGNPSVNYLMVESLASVIPSLFLLTATPEQLGLEGHFARLRLLDPHRFTDYESFYQEHSTYTDLVRVVRPLISSFHQSPSAEGLLQLQDFFQRNFQGKIDENLFTDLDRSEEKRRLFLKIVLDLYGTGRVFFRNTRSSLKTELSKFPQRIVKIYPLDNLKNEAKGANQKLDWLSDLLKQYSAEKILLICKTRKLASEVEKGLKERLNVCMALFHDGQTLMNRDRQAAYFADPKGAQILLCTEVGSEGRNFQFAHHLVLFDLPSNPDVLEQRIGRLDRIGQKENITIHIPYLKNTSEEILFHWYHEGFNAFEKTTKGGSQLYSHFSTSLKSAMEDPLKYLRNDKLELTEMIQQTQRLYAEISQKYEEGRDFLTEHNSFEEVKAKSVIDEIQKFESTTDLKSYMEKIFELLGVHSEDLDGRSYFLKPNHNMYIPHFPGLTSAGATATYERELALEREDMLFLTWDHPMVSGVIELLLEYQIGNVTVNSWKENVPPRSLLLETVFIAECVAPPKLQISRYFPPTTLRVVVDKEAKDCTSAWSYEQIKTLVVNADQVKLKAVKNIPKDFLKNLLRESLGRAEARFMKLIDEYIVEMVKNFDQEIFRLQELQKKNPLLSDAETRHLMDSKNELLSYMNKAQIRLDSLRLIF